MAVHQMDQHGYFEWEYGFRRSPEYLQTILDAADEALAVVDADMRIMLANKRFILLMGIQDREDPLSPGSGKPFIIEHPGLREILSTTSAVREFEADFNVSGLGRRIMRVNVQPLHGEDNRAPLVLVSISDMTALHELREELRREMEGCGRAREELLDSGKRFQILVETMNDGLAVRDEKGLLTYVNKGLCDMLGYSREEMIGHPVHDFFDKESRHVYSEHMRRREKGMHEQYELRWIRKDGRGLDILMSPMPIYGAGGSIRGSFAIVTDITDRKRAETALRDSEKKLRVLSNHLLMAQEHEREHISRELHDELGQDLTVLKYQLRFIEKRLRKDQRQLREACLDSLQHIDDLVESTRRISRNLSPHNLQSLGLAASLRRTSHDLAEGSGIEVSVNVGEIDHVLSQEAEILLYRIFQEALKNVARYARASRVNIEVKEVGNAVLCSIVDNGIGFDVARAKAELSESSDMGLIAMEERARMVGGALQIMSQKGFGTRILLTIPTGEKGKVQ